MPAVRADQVAAGELALVAAGDVTHAQHDAIRVLSNRRDLRALQYRGAGLAGALAQDGLQARLVQEPAPAGAHRVDAVVEIGNDVDQLAAGETVHGDQRAVRNEFLRRLLTHARFDAEPAEHLHGAHVEKSRARQRRALLEAFDRDRANALLREERGGGEPGEPAAGDQNRRFIFHAPSLSNPRRRCATANEIARTSSAARR